MPLTMYYHRAVAICAAGAAGISLLVLVSWVLGQEQRSALGAWYVPMAPSTAGLMILLGGAAFLRARRQTGGMDFKTASRYVPTLVFLAVVSAVLMSFMVGSRVLLGITLPVERLLNPTTNTVGGIPLGLMSPLTATVFLLNACALGLQSRTSGCRRPYREIASIAALAALVISLAVLFSYATGAPLLYGSGVIPMALPTAISFILLSGALLMAAGPDAWPLSIIDGGAGVSSFPAGRPSRKGPFLILLGSFLVIGSVGIFVLRNQFALSRQAAREHLAAISDLKSREIAAWYRERLGDAEVIFNNPLALSEARAFLEEPGNARLRRGLLTWMESVQKQYDYPVVALYDVDRAARLIVSARDAKPELACASDFPAAFPARGVFVVDLHRDRAAAADLPPIHLSFWIPIFPGEGKAGTVRGAFLLQVDPYELLYPLIQSWPTPSRTAETLLVRREGDEVVFLNELRHRKNSALSLRMPIGANPQLPAVRAVLGPEGILEGRDYRNVPVLAAVRGVPGTPWSMVAKIDQEEIFTPLRERARNTGFLLLAVMIATTFGVGFLDRRREGAWLRQRLAAEQERQALAERFRVLFEQAAVGVAEVDTRTGRFLRVNRRYCELIGVTAEELLGTSFQAITHPEDLQANLDNMALLKAGRIREFSMEKRFLRKDGTVVWVNLTVSPLWAPGEAPTHHLAVVHDISERKRAEEEIRTKADLLNLTGRLAKVGGWEFDVETLQGTWTDEVALIHDLDPKQETNVELGLSFYTSEARPLIERAIKDAIEFSTPYDLELELISAKGVRKWVRTLGNPVRERGKVVKVAGIIQDITDRKNAERVLRKSETRFQSLFTNMVEGFAYCRMLFENEQPQDFVYLEVNDAFRTLTGLKDVVGKKVSEIIPGIRESDPELFAIYGRVALTGRPERFETYVAALKMWFAISVYSPEKEYFIAVFDVITKRKQDEAALRQQLAYLNLLNRITRAVAERQQPDSMLHVVLERLVDDLPADAVFVLYYDQAVDEFAVRQHKARNEALAAAIGWTEGAQVPTEQAGLRFCLAGETIFLRDTAATEASIFQKMAGQGLRSCIVAPLVASERVFGLISVLRREAGGFSDGEVDFVSQLSAHVALALYQARLHEDLQNAYDEVRATQKAVLQQERLRALGQMSSGIAHDINNSLSPIMMHTELILMREANLSDQSRQYLRTVLQAATDIASTVGRMREFYRSREEQEILLPVNLGEIVEDVINLTQPRWRDMPQKNGIVVEIATKLQPRLPHILGIESELREVLTNLIINAVDAMPDGGTITIGTTFPGLGPSSDGGPAETSSVVLWVRDTGIGMDEETKLHCLEPFFTKKGEGGTGLGLAMVYGIMQRHHAAIEIESEPGCGTAFRLVFPVPEQEAARSAPPAAPPRYAGPHLRILCIDDETLLLEGMQLILAGDGHAVQCRGDGRSGLEAFRAAKERGEPFHVVITDLGMPGIDGRHVAATVKRESPGTHVILLTGWGEQMKKDENLPKGVDLILSKPPKVEVLRQALARMPLPKQDNAAGD